MKAKLLLFIFLFYSVCVTAKQAPNFSLESSGLQGQLSELQGQVVYLDFWASWCKPCRKSFPWMNTMQQRYAAKGLQIITVNLDQDPKLVDQFLSKVSSNLPIVYDPQGNIAKAYQLLGMPSSYLIDRQGNIRQTHQGFFNKKTARYEQEIKLLLNELE
ncbi:TlpA disulfide reductase family protein [Alteromonadaceae bacterium BrNp21-10]|nr:TlpA disulfide reductase family protein [Alteromonadaceae bacterium BrNp21-10]